MVDLHCDHCGQTLPHSGSSWRESGACQKVEAWRQAPTKIDGVPVEIMGKPLAVNGEEWVTLVPEGEDERLWEWSLTTGRLLRVA